MSGPICRAYRAGLNKISSFTHVYQIPPLLPPAFHHSLIVQLGFFLLSRGLSKNKFGFDFFGFAFILSTDFYMRRYLRVLIYWVVLVKTEIKNILI